MDVEYIRTTNNLVQKSKRCKSLTNTAVKIINQTVRLRELPAYGFMARPRMPRAILLAIGAWSANGPTNATEACDIRAESWINVTNKIEHPHVYRGIAFLNGYIYCGFERLENCNSVRKFDLIARTWLKVSPMYCHRC